MATNNLFLVPTGDHSTLNHYAEDCFCEFCRNLRIVSNSGKELRELYRLFSWTLPGKQSVYLYRYHNTVLEQIAAHFIGKYGEIL